MANTREKSNFRAQDDSVRAFNNGSYAGQITSSQEASALSGDKA